MTGVSFAIMALVKSMGPKCPKGQTIIDGQDGCFNNYCTNYKCPIEGMGVDYSKPPNCPCNKECPEGFINVYDISKGKQACEKKCGSSTKTSKDDLCAYYEPLKNASSDKIGYLNTAMYISTSNKNIAFCNLGDESKWANGPDGKFPIVCNNPGECALDDKNEPYCKITTGNNCTGINKKIGCIGTTCVNGTCKKIVDNYSGVGFCVNNVATNVGICCEEDKLSININGKITCCGVNQTPINMDNDTNKVNAPGGCCISENLSGNGTCCDSKESRLGDICCPVNDRIIVTNTDGTETTVCCSGNNVIKTQAYTQLGKVENICTEYNSNAYFGNGFENAKNSQQCYTKYKSINGDLPKFNYIYYHNGKCMLGCNKLISQNNFTPSKSLLNAVPNNPSCYNKVCNAGDESGDPIISDGNYIFKDAADTLYWKVPDGITANTINRETTMKIKQPISQQCLNELTSDKNFPGCLEVLGNNYSNLSYNPNTKTCTGTILADDFFQTICNENGVRVDGKWIDNKYPYRNNSCGNLAPKWNGKSYLNNIRTVNSCITASNCLFLQDGKYCQNGSLDGLNCLTNKQTQDGAKSCNALDDVTSNMYCVQPGGTKNPTSSPIYKCLDGSGGGTVGYNKCCGNGIVSQDGNYKCICTGPFGQDANNPSSPCIKSSYMYLLNTCTSFGSSPMTDATPHEGNKLPILSIGFTPAYSTGGIAHPVQELLILSTQIKSGKNTSTVYLNNIAINSKQYLGVTDGSVSLGVLLVIGDYGFWNSQGSLASSSAAAICGLTGNKYYRALNNADTASSSDKGKAIFDVNSQNLSSNQKSIIPVPVSFNSQTNKWSVVLASVHIGYNCPDCVYLSGDGIPGKVNFATVNSSNQLEFNKSIILGEDEPFDSSKLPSGITQFEVEIAYNITSPSKPTATTGYNVTDIVGNMKINDILTTFKNNAIS